MVTAGRDRVVWRRNAARAELGSLTDVALLLAAHSDGRPLGMDRHPASPPKGRPLMHPGAQSHQLQLMRPAMGVQMTAGWPGVSMTVLEPKGLTIVGGADGDVGAIVPFPAEGRIVGAPPALCRMMPCSEGDRVIAGPFGGWIIAPAPNGMTSVCAATAPLTMTPTKSTKAKQGTGTVMAMT